jgi:hypothetical protein
MAWYNFWRAEKKLDAEEKENPAQYIIAQNEGFFLETREVVTNYRNAYEQLRSCKPRSQYDCRRCCGNSF